MTAFNLKAIVLFLSISFGIELAAQHPFKTIVIDPGHGGKDKGSTWDTLLEKNLVLNFARYFQELGCGEECKIVLLRTDDEYFTFNGRTEKIKSYNPDLIISLHHNMNADPNLSGVQVFYCRENYYEKTSLDIAKKVMTALPRDIPVINSPEHANFLVLRDVSCPGILIEIGYLTNQHDRSVILSESYQKRFAEAVLKAVLK
jgi:N-acetylmuramoyl-L-alanine amidase